VFRSAFDGNPVQEIVCVSETQLSPFREYPVLHALQLILVPPSAPLQFQVYQLVVEVISDRLPELHAAAPEGVVVTTVPLALPQIPLIGLLVKPSISQQVYLQLSLFIKDIHLFSLQTHRHNLAQLETLFIVPA
jgi:hypothetical protein